MGKVMGLDRIPEVRTLRAKLSALCSQAGEASAWSGILAKEWMDVQALQAAGVYYADGHVRVYHGKLTKLPRRYMPGRGSACAAPPTTGSMPLDGQPFFLVTYPVDPGIVKVLREDIVPGLEREAGLQDAPGRGRRPYSPSGAVAKAISQASRRSPEGGAWSVRAMARETGLSKSNVQRL